jgi:hypothetical protein
MIIGPTLAKGKFKAACVVRSTHHATPPARRSRPTGILFDPLPPLRSNSHCRSIRRISTAPISKAPMRIRVLFAVFFGLMGVALIAAGVAATFTDLASLVTGTSASARVTQYAATHEGGSLAIAGSLCILAAAVLVRPARVQ